MGLIDFLGLRPPRQEIVRADPIITLGDYAKLLEQAFYYQGFRYTYPHTQQEDVGRNFSQIAQGAYKGSGVIFACVLSRMQLFSEMRFMYRRLRESRPGDLFGNRELRILERPWENGTTGDLLAKMLLYADLAGNAYVLRRGGRLVPLRPDWVSVVGGVPGDEDATVWHPEARVLGYLYQEGGPSLDRDPIVLLPEEVAHFAPNPDPETRFTGMSWITPIVKEVMADKAATEHKLTFFENGATPNLIVSFDQPDLEKVQKWVELFKAQHEGVANAYKTLFLGAGADATAVGANFQQLEFKVTQGAGETRIAAAAGVPPVIVGLSEGLAAATYSNYAQARRRFADNTIRPLWRNACASLSNIVVTPPDAELWYDDRDISALQEDQKDAAEIQMTRSSSIKMLLDAGFTAETVIKAVDAEDFTLLEHSGLFSVQLQPPGSQEPEPEPEPTVNGNGNGRSDDDWELIRALEMAANEAYAQQREVPAPVVHVHNTIPERDVHVDVAAAEPSPVSVTVEPPPPAEINVNVPPVRFEEGAIQVAAPEVTVEPAVVNISPPEVTVEAPEVHVEPQIKIAPKRRKVKFSDGREASIDDGRVTFSDGREATIEEE